MADFYVVLNSWSDTDLYSVTRRTDLFRFTNRCRMDLTDLEVALVGIYQQPIDSPSKDTKPTPKPTPKPPAASKANPPKPPANKPIVIVQPTPAATSDQSSVQPAAQPPAASGSAQSGAQPPAADGTASTGSRPKRSLRKEPDGGDVAVDVVMLSDQPAKPLATVGAVVVVECDAVVTTLFGSTCAQMLRVIDHFGDYEPLYVRCMDGPTTTMTVTNEGGQMSSVPSNLLLVLHFRKRQMYKGGWSPVV